MYGMLTCHLLPTLDFIKWDQPLAPPRAHAPSSQPHPLSPPAPGVRADACTSGTGEGTVALSPVTCSNSAWLFPGEACPAPPGEESSSLLTIDFSVVALPLFITCCLSAEFWPSWEMSTTTSDWISLFWFQAYKEVKHPQRSQLLSPPGAESMLVLLTGGWSQLTVLALPAGPVLVGLWRTASASCVTMLLTPRLGEVRAWPGPGLSWSTICTF